MSLIRHRAACERGFTLVELLAAVTVLGVLVAIAVPSFLGYRERAERRSAETAVRAGIVALQAYRADTGGYGGATLAGLRAGYDRGLPSLGLVPLDRGGMRVEATVGGCSASASLPSTAVGSSC